MTSDIALDSEQVIRRAYKVAGVTVFRGLSVISGTSDALASVRDLRATAFVDSLAETRAQLAESGWMIEGSLGAGSSLLASDPDGMLAEFVEIPGGTA